MSKLKNKHIPRTMSKKAQLERMIRVDHAGEYGAVRIYEGQLAVFGDNHPMSDTVKHMKEQEEVHLDHFNKLIREYNARPTLITPFWHMAGFALGAGTALMGTKAAMVCTEAVEEVIDQHYAEQIEYLADDEGTLSKTLEKFRQEEIEHKQIAINNGAQELPAHGLLYGAIKLGVKAAIKIAERI
ncbi:MAG: demethoxyubiquinone hydroxylase family protein [Emcibacteraceae bacterium]|jgi:ubiquinone biosynthesis monooxygenase Coq7|nr:demethoxyubiquinone hydroxylase family protein [Emcibacteraceae bacterium]MDC1428400.1 demethoxyubiquinone hydroxylase family protein [Emcibacteraceae bacterium]MDG1005137.1 demethoxyubiquinone hydroxylase family protein [Emcibacteraceae bacterium]|tara:strand:- start:4239 stop:4793 length:555 start_codon:yes stop_codon:yes gene_type:complete